MAINKEDVMKRANQLYAEAKLGTSAGYTPPEATPKIQIDSVKCAVAALVEAFNEQLEDIKTEISDVYRHLDERD